MKRVRDARKPEHLGNEGILILDHQDRENIAAADLGLDAPKKGSFISAYVVPAEDDSTGASAAIEGRRGGWRRVTIRSSPPQSCPSRAKEGRRGLTPIDRKPIADPCRRSASPSPPGAGKEQGPAPLRAAP
jgi:Restriction endonuclease NaeI